MWTARRIAHALNMPYEKDDFPIENIHFDTRFLGPNDCFIALDKGHDYLSKVSKTSVGLTIGERDADIIVENSHDALIKLGVYARDNTTAKRIAITGSVGKTTTTHFLNQVLSQVFNVIAPQGSFNNHIGVPLTLTKLTPQTEVGIFELGSNNPGEISILSHWVKPDIAIIINVSETHIGQYSNGLEGILHEKLSIQSGLKEGGELIVPESLRPYVQYDNVRIFDESKLGLIEAFITQEHHRLNLLPVLEVLDILNISYDQIDFSKLTLPEGRGKTHQIVVDGKNITLIDDAYNAPFLGMKAAIYELSKYKRRRVAVLADMGELGGYAFSLHQEILDLAENLNVDLIIPCGEIFAKLLERSVVQQDHIVDLLENEDVVLFKGSHSSGLHQIVGRLLSLYDK